MVTPFVRGELTEVRDRLAALAIDQAINFKARKYLSGAVTRLNDALGYVPAEDETPDRLATPIARFDILAAAIQRAVEQNDCTLAVIERGRRRRGWQIKVHWNFDRPNEYTTYIGYRSASQIVKDWQPAPTTTEQATTRQ